MLNISGTVRDRDRVSMKYYALLNSVISTDLQQLRKVFININIELIKNTE